MSLRVGTRIAAFFVVALLAAVLPLAPAGSVTVFSGACTMDLDVEASAPITVTPALRTLELSGGGACVVNGAPATMTFVGAIRTHPTFQGFSCAGGVAAGQALFSLSSPGFADMTLEVTVTVAAGAVVIVATNSLLRYDGVAVLVQEPADTQACLSAGMTRTTWLGTLGFQDPEPMPL